MLSEKQLSNLREEIVLGSLFVGDYSNSFGLNVFMVMDFFNGYVEYLADLMREDHGDYGYDFFNDLNKYDTDENLYEWYCSFENDPLPLPLEYNG